MVEAAQLVDRPPQIHSIRRGVAGATGEETEVEAMEGADEVDEAVVRQGMAQETEQEMAQGMAPGMARETELELDRILAPAQGLD